MPQTPDNGDMVDIKDNENPMRIEEEEEDDTNDVSYHISMSAYGEGKSQRIDPFTLEPTIQSQYRSLSI